MAEQDLLNAFDDCVDRLAAGNTMDDCLRRYPQCASALRPMLEAGRLVHRTRFTPAEVTESQNRVRFRVAQAVNTRRRHPRPVLLRIAPLVASFMVIFVLTVGATGVLAENSLPGDPLYGLKRFTENIRLSVASDKDALEQQFDERRIDEIQRLIAQNRAAEVSFEGQLEAISGTYWLVAGLPVQIAPGTALAQPGDIIEVQASTTSQGQIIASSIRRIGGERTPEPTPIPPTNVPTRAPILTPSPTPSATHTPSQTATPTLTLTTTKTITPTSTSSPTPSVTVEPTLTACVPAQPQGWVVYTVQPNDNLSSLAVGTGITLDELMRGNCLTNSNLIVTGQRLYLPFIPSEGTSQASPEPGPDLGNEGNDNSGENENAGSGNGNSGPGGGGGNDDDNDNDNDNGNDNSDDDDS